MLDQRRAAGQGSEPAPRRQQVAERRQLRGHAKPPEQLRVPVHKRHSAPPVKQGRGLVLSELVQSDRGRGADRMSQRAQLLETVADRILRLPSDRKARVGIDGVDGAGKTMFADELAQILRAASRPVIRASVDGFHHPKAERYRRGRNSPEGYFEDSYNYSALKAVLLDPLSPGGSGRYRAAVFDHVTDTPVAAPERVAAPASILVFDGIFLHRPELRKYWDVSMFLDVAFAVSVARCAQRDGTSPDPAAAANRRYVEGQKLYLRNMRPARAGNPDDRQQRSVGALHRPHVGLKAPPCCSWSSSTSGTDPKPIGERFKRKGRMLPEGVVYHASWVEPGGAPLLPGHGSARRCVAAGLGRAAGRTSPTSRSCRC